MSDDKGLDLWANINRSVYKFDFQGKPARRPTPVQPKDNGNWMADPYELEVLTSEFYEKAEDKSKIKTINDTFDRIIKPDKVLSEIVSSPNEEIVNVTLTNATRTMYQVDYCRVEDGFESKKTKSRVRIPIPDYWGATPDTTYGCSYRNLNRITKWKTEKITPQKSSFDPNPKEREAMNVTTGGSEYRECIGRLGQAVVDYGFYGEVKRYSNEYIYVPPAKES